MGGFVSGAFAVRDPHIASTIHAETELRAPWQETEYGNQLVARTRVMARPRYTT